MTGDTCCYLLSNIWGEEVGWGGTALNCTYMVVVSKLAVAFPDKDLGSHGVFFHQLDDNSEKASVLLKAVVKASENKTEPRYGMFYKSCGVPSS